MFVTLLIQGQALPIWAGIGINFFMLLIVLFKTNNSIKEAKKNNNKEYLDNNYVSKIDYEQDKSEENTALLEKQIEISEKFHTILDNKLKEQRRDLKKDILEYINLAISKVLNNK